jgi:tRNA(Ile)-lysidine synthase
MFLTAAWCKARRIAPPLALTVDHALRENSAEEARRVATWARAHDIPHETLIWKGPKPAENIQARAREERYRLIGEAMRARRLKVLLTGHTEDDQAETFLLRLARGSGVDGLSGMAPVAPFPLAEFADLTLSRPLLALSHAELMAELTRLGQPWIEDPSNANDRFARVKIRAARSALADAGLTPGRIAAASAHLRRARDAIDAGVAALIADAVDITPWGYAVAKADRIAIAPREIALRAVARLVQALGGAAFPPRFEQTEGILAWFEEASPRGRTLGGCRLARRPDGTILIAREEAALAKDDPVVAVAPGAAALWDRRFEVALSRSPGPCEVRRLGAAGLKALGLEVQLAPVEPRRVAAATPALWRAGRLVAAPLLGFSAPGIAVSARFVALSRVKDPLRKHL